MNAHVGLIFGKESFYQIARRKKRGRKGVTTLQIEERRRTAKTQWGGGGGWSFSHYYFSPPHRRCSLNIVRFRGEKSPPAGNLWISGGGKKGGQHSPWGEKKKEPVS